MSFETLDKVWKGSYLACLYDAYTHFNNCHKLMQIKTKPTRAVITTDKVKARELRLVPLTTAITFNKEGENVANAICVGQAFMHPTRGHQMLAWLSPRCTLPKSAQLASGSASSGPETFVVPFWAVRTTHDGSLANMEVDTIPVTRTTKLGEKVSGKFVFDMPIMRNNVALEAHVESHTCP